MVSICIREIINHSPDYKNMPANVTRKRICLINMHFIRVRVLGPRREPFDNNLRFVGVDSQREKLLLYYRVYAKNKTAFRVIIKKRAIN